MSKKFRLGVVGYGYIGQRHARLIAQHPQTELIGIADVNPEREVLVASQLDVPFYPSLSALLEHQPDIVHICTPNGFHAPQAIEALEADCHVVVEKPMALSVAECEAMMETAKAQKRNIYCVVQNRYSPVSRWLEEVIRQKRLGKIFWVEVNCFWNRDDRYYLPGSWRGTLQYDGGPLFTQYSHFLDILCHVFGEPTDIQAEFENFTHLHNTEFEDTGRVWFRLPTGGMGSIHYSNAVYDRNFESSIRIIGEKGTIQIGGQYMNEVTYCHIKGYEMPTLAPSAPANQYAGYTGSADHHALVIADVLAHLQGKPNRAVGAREGMRVVALIEGIYQFR
jgi:predicted dehydrogenase